MTLDNFDNNANENEYLAEDLVEAQIPEQEITEEPQARKFKIDWQVFTSKKARRNIVIALSALLICGAVYMNWVFFSDDSVKGGEDDKYVIDYTGGDNSVAASENGQPDYFASTQISRQKARDEAIEVFQLVLENNDALAEIKESALTSMTKIASFIEAEGNIESLVCAKGFSSCVAVVNENSATVIVKSDGLLPNEVAQISEIACDQTSLPASAIKIIEMP